MPVLPRGFDYSFVDYKLNNFTKEKIKISVKEIEEELKGYENAN